MCYTNDDSDGWVKLPAAIKDWEGYSDPNALLVLICLMISVDHPRKQFKWKNVAGDVGITHKEVLNAMKIIQVTSRNIDFIETLLIRLQDFQDQLQTTVDPRKNRKKVNSGGFTFNVKMTHIYLMKDTRTGYVKIGRSINPKYREKTLQSEIPTIETIFISPLTWLVNEGKLHREFKGKRIRGEWFALTERDINFIVNFKYTHE